MLQALSQGQRVVFVFVEALVILQVKHMVKVIAKAVVQSYPEIHRLDHLVCLGIDQFQDIVKGDGDIDALGHPRQDIHLVHAALQVFDHLGAFDSQGCLVAEGFQESQILIHIGLAGAARAYGQPTDQVPAAGKWDE